VLKDESFHNNQINHASQISHTQQQRNLQQPRQLILPQQAQNADLSKIPNTNFINKSAYVSSQNNLSPSNLSPSINKNVNTNPINNSMQPKDFYHSPSSSYYNHTQKNQVNENDNINLFKFIF
jgi:hypothetical protein